MGDGNIKMYIKETTFVFRLYSSLPHGAKREFKNS